MFRNKGWPVGGVLAPHEVPDDPAIPGLPVLLDAAAAGDLLRGWLRASGASSEGCSIRHVRYRPGRDCTVVYELAGWERPVGTPPLLTARAFAEAPPPRRLERWGKRARREGVSGPVFGWLPDAGVVLTTFPVDLRLPGLAGLADGSAVSSALSSARGRSTTVAGGEHAVSIVSYKPTRSCLVRCRVASTGPGSRERVVYARMHRDDRGAEAFRVMTLLRDGDDLADRVAEPLCHEASRRLLVEAEVPGTPLVERLSHARLSEWCAVTGRALAAVHRHPGTGGNARTAERELQSLAKAGRRLLSALPPALARFDRLIERLAVGGSGPGRSRLLHGDFSAGQVLVEGSRLTLIDFERTSAGDPLLDVGSFLARFEVAAGDSAVGDGDASRAIECFVASYADAAGTDVDPAGLAWHRAVGFARLALHAVRHLKPGWPDRAAGFLERAAAGL